MLISPKLFRSSQIAPKNLLKTEVTRSAKIVSSCQKLYFLFSKKQAQGQTKIFSHNVREVRFLELTVLKSIYVLGQVNPKKENFRSEFQKLHSIFEIC